MAHIVTAPLVITKKEDGSDLYLYAGAELPEFVSDDEVKRLLAEDFVEKVDGRSSSAKGKPSAESN